MTHRTTGSWRRALIYIKWFYFNTPKRLLHVSVKMGGERTTSISYVKSLIFSPRKNSVNGSEMFSRSMLTESPYSCVIHWDIVSFANCYIHLEAYTNRWFNFWYNNQDNNSNQKKKKKEKNPNHTQELWNYREFRRESAPSEGSFVNRPPL